MLPVIPMLVASVMFLFLVFFFSVKITLGRKLFCFFTSIMLGAFCLLYAIILMANFEAVNDLWESTRLLTLESGLVSLGLSALILIAFFKILTKDLPMLLREERINGMWDFLFLIPLMALLLIGWITPEYPKYLLLGRYRIITLVVLPLIPFIVLLIYYLLWWVAAKFSESARLQQESTMLQMESKRYEELRNYMEETSELRHNFRQHILVIKKLSNAGKFDELQDYLAQFEDIADKSYAGYCENIAVDAVASYYTAFAENQNIKIEWDLKLPHNIPLKEAEYCAILGNLLENSLRAVKDLSQERRYDGTMKVTADRNIFSVDIVLHCNS